MTNAAITAHPRRIPPSTAILLGLLMLVPAVGASGCDGRGGPAEGPDGGAGAGAPSPDTDPGPCDLALSELALYQSVKIPLVREGTVVGERTAEVVRRRDALVRAFVRPGAAWGGRAARARLTVVSDGVTTTYDDTKTVRGATTDGDLDSGFAFFVPAAAVGAAVKLTVAVTAPASCAAAAVALPAADVAPRTTGVLRVKLVPIRYDSDGSGRMPDVSEAQIARYVSLIKALYPVETIELTVRPVVGTTIPVVGDGWSELLDSLRALREEDRPSSDVYYYGVVVPAESMGAYCKTGSCTAGIAFQVMSPNDSPLRVGVGLGYAGESAAAAMAHEVGHGHGLGHAPCGAASGLDARYPYAGGAIGSWGWDSRYRALYDPAVFTDTMGYCRRQWLSDYSYQVILARGAAVNRGAETAVAAETRALSVAPSADAPVAAWRVLLVGADGGTRWGQPLPVARPAFGTALRARVLDGSGDEVTQVDVFRTELSEGAGASVLIPPPEPGWFAIEVPGGAPLPFAAGPATRPLR